MKKINDFEKLDDWVESLKKNIDKNTKINKKINKESMFTPFKDNDQRIGKFRMKLSSKN